jgi:uncharacterized protein YcbX
VTDNPHLAGIRLHPIKSLDGVQVPACRIGPGGGLDLDRVWALYSLDGEGIHGKNNAAMHVVRAVFAPDLGTVTLSTTGDHRHVAPATFAFPSDFAAAAEWFSEYLGQQVVVRYAAEGYPDDMIRNGPLVVSTATLQAVADWFPGIDLEESRRRFRSSLEIGGTVAFWEDRLFREQETDAVPFTIGDVRLEGTNPCPRCAVPARDSQSGVEMTGFQKRFSELRQAHYPSWARAAGRIRHFYHLGINTRVAPPEYGKVLRLGDVVINLRADP